jgi:hypothetical protein
MTEQQARTTTHRDPTCAFCAGVLAAADCIASIRLLSHARGQRSFGAHVKCLQRAVRPELARLLDLDDVPPGLDHFLTVSA